MSAVTEAEQPPPAHPQSTTEQGTRREQDTSTRVHQHHIPLLQESPPSPSPSPGAGDVWGRPSPPGSVLGVRNCLAWLALLLALAQALICSI